MSTSEIDIDALLGGGSDSDDGLSVSDVDEDDPSLAAELNAMQGGTSAAASGSSRADELRARLGALQQEASKLKAAGDIPAALAKMREAKAANDELMALQEAPAPAPAPAASSSPGPARTPTLSRRGMTLAQLDERIKELQTAAVMDNRRGDTEGAVAKFREAKALQQQRAKLADGMSDLRSALTQPFHSACTLKSLTHVLLCWCATEVSDQAQQLLAAAKAAKAAGDNAQAEALYRQYKAAAATSSGGASTRPPSQRASLPPQVQCAVATATRRPSPPPWREPHQ